MGAKKRAVLDQNKQAEILSACSEHEFVPIWLMLKCGMHPIDVIFRRGRTHEKTKLDKRSGKRFFTGEKVKYDGLTFDGEWLRYKRCKNQEPREFLVPPDVVPRLVEWMARGRFITPNGLYGMVHRVGERVGIPDLSPMSLRHTFAIESLRRHHGDVFLTSASMGASVPVVTKNYLNLREWEEVHGEQHQPAVVQEVVVPERAQPASTLARGLVPANMIALARRASA